MAKLALSDPAYAAQLDARPLNPATGFLSARDLYEFPRRAAVGAEGSPGTSP